MASKLRVFTKRFFIITNFIVVFIFLLACLAPYLNPQKWWVISMLGLGFPVLLILVLLFLLIWVIVKIRWASVSAIALLLGFKSIGVFFSFGSSRSFDYKRTPNTIRVVSWNVARFVEMKRNNNKGSQTRMKMMELIKEQDADILCLQEFFHSYDSTYYPNINYISENFNYPYWYYSHDVDGDKHYTGSIIFSRFPIIDSGMIRYPRPTLPDALVHADIKAGNDTIRVYATHLQSLQFAESDYRRIDNITDGDSLLTNSKTIFSKIKNGMTHRSIQANIIAQRILGLPRS